MKGYVTFFLVMLALGLIINLGQATWPVCVPAAVAGGAWILTSRSKNLASKAIHDVLGPTSVGLLLVCALLLLFHAANPSPDTMGNMERALIYADSHVPPIVKLTALRFVVAMILLTVVAYLRPGQKPLSRFFTAKKWVGRSLSVLSIATTFTFFTNVAVVQPRAPDIYNKIEAIYRRSRNKQAKSVARYLACKAVQRALPNLQNAQLTYVNDLVSTVANVSTMDMAGKKILSQYAALQLHPGAAAEIRGEDMLVAVSPLPHPDALSLLDHQLLNEKVAASFAEEALRSAKESVSFGNGMLKELGWSLVEGLVNEQGGEMLRLTKPFIDKILDKYIDSYTEPIIKQQAEKVQGFFRHPDADSTAQELARRDIRSAEVWMSADQTKKAEAAAHQALESAQKAKIEFGAGSEDQALADLNNAERASTDSQTAAHFASDAANSLKDAAEAFGAGSHQVQIAASVAGAAEAAAALRAAAGVEEAMKTTKTAAQIVEDARAARSAAEAAEAAKMIFRAIPK